MYPFWEDLVEPALTLLRPKRVVEIGSENGFTTVRLLGFCQRHRAVLHAIDPAPCFDVQQYRQQFEGHFVFHQETSLAALPKVDGYQAILIDGDHNWYTVFHELKAIQQQTRRSGTEFPLAFLHDAGWPYGRRDLYYNPQSIPPEFRQPYAQAGILPGRSQLQSDHGVNSHLYNAMTEGNPRNGVLTAIEDFAKSSETQLELTFVPGLAGLAILRPASLRRQHPRLAAFLDTWHLPNHVKRYIGRVEDIRIKGLIRSSGNAAAYRRSQAEQARQIEALQATVQALTAELEAAKNELTELTTEPSDQLPASERR